MASYSGWLLFGSGMFVLGITTGASLLTTDRAIMGGLLMGASLVVAGTTLSLMHVL